MRIMRIGRANAIASLWGFAEATVFFIVPDVLLSWLALRSPKSGLIACLFALLGALIGGSAGLDLLPPSRAPPQAELVE